MYVFETFLAGIHWNALERILERVRNANGARSKRKWTRSERKWNRMQC